MPRHELVSRPRGPVRDRERVKSPELAETREGWKARLLRVLPEVEKHTGFLGQELLQKLTAGRINHQKFSTELEAIPDFQEFQEKGMEFLEQIGVVEKQGGSWLLI